MDRQPDCTARARETIHDLRNLFGIVASARHMLGDPTASERQGTLLDAIETAAIEGGRLTTSLLAAAPKPSARTNELNRLVNDLRPLICAAAGMNCCDDLRTACCSLPTSADADELKAAILELVRNARAASPTGGCIFVRTHRHGGRAWLTVADRGCGMDARTLAAARSPAQARSGNGTGLVRINRFVRSAHGQLHIRSRPGGGTVMAIVLPLVLKPALSAQAEVEARRTPITWKKERKHEDRHPVAA